jgi:mannose-6-phosphate isomerase-like protein (cupin superfamily)
MIQSARTEKKVWGTVRHVFESFHAAVSILEVEAGTFCSRHSHAQRVNRFIVQSGSIDIVEYEDDGEKVVSRLTMSPGDVHDVEAGVVHRFEVIESGIVVEVYFPARPGDVVFAEDIERLDTGGRK